MARSGLSVNENACALISMMARSKCSNQRPDTLMQDRLPPDRRKPLATRGRTIQLGQKRRFDDVRAESASPSLATFERTSRDVANVPKGDLYTATVFAIAPLPLSRQRHSS